jgi:dihydrofolate synthase / folylpolyglutamate synthase
MLSLADWLILLEHRASPNNIILDLERIKLASSELDLTSFNAKVIKIAGTNGKGSSVAALNQIYTAAGYRVACYSSPHLFEFNERLKINDKYTEDSLWCQAFCHIDDSAIKHNLTYFEIITLAAFWIIKQYTLDIVLLEIGLGGRLDAVNVAAADVGLITSIGLDHQDRLGSTLEAIAKEKAGIINKNMSVVFSGRNNRNIIEAEAKGHNCDFYALDAGFSWAMANENWVYNCCETSHSMPIPNIHPDVASGVITCVTLLQPNFPVANNYIYSNLPNIQQYARCQIVKKKYPIVIDVAHNKPAVIYLKQFVRCNFSAKKLRLVFSCLNTKDYKSMLSEFDCDNVTWYLSDLGVANGVKKNDIRQAISSECFLFPSISCAFEKAWLDCQKNEMVVVFGSFYVAKEALAFLGNNN